MYVCKTVTEATTFSMFVDIASSWTPSIGLTLTAKDYGQQTYYNNSSNIHS